jgi:hypothetical protein
MADTYDTSMRLRRRLGRKKERKLLLLGLSTELARNN